MQRLLAACFLAFSCVCSGICDDSWAVQTLLMEDMPPSELHQLLHANDLLNAALQRWQALLALGLDDLADPSGNPLQQALDQLLSNDDLTFFLLHCVMAGACWTCISLHKRVRVVLCTLPGWKSWQWAPCLC